MLFKKKPYYYYIAYVGVKTEDGVEHKVVGYKIVKTTSKITIKDNFSNLIDNLNISSDEGQIVITNIIRLQES